MAYVNPSHRFLGWSLTLFPVGYARNNSTGKHLRAFLIRCETTWTASCKCSGVWTLLWPLWVLILSPNTMRFNPDSHCFCEKSQLMMVVWIDTYTVIRPYMNPPVGLILLTFTHTQDSTELKENTCRDYTAWVCKETHITSRFKPMLTYCKTSFRYPCDYRERLLSYILHKAVHKNIWWHINSSECSDIFEIVSIWC